jgi:transcriptional regulator with XRE-family HTH domain
MDLVRFGLSMRALRRRRGWTQEHLSRLVGVSRQVIGRIERGHADEVTARTLAAVATKLGATVNLRVLWHGEGLDRLLDAVHADLTDSMLGLLDVTGWLTATEVTFNVRGERGSIDILAFHADTGTLLVIEIKSVVPDLQSMLGTLDRKARLAREIAKERGWNVRTIARLLVLPDDRTARRRVDRHRAIFDVAFPARTAAVRRWLAAPAGPFAGIMFLTDARQAGTRHRIAARAAWGHAPSRTRSGLARPRG